MELQVKRSEDQVDGTYAVKDQSVMTEAWHSASF